METCEKTQPEPTCHLCGNGEVKASVKGVDMCGCCIERIVSAMRGG